jgi:parvulin-like peptidyl-prolyl isomerase
MSPLDAVSASVAGSRLTLGGLLKRLQVQARLGPLIREALARQYVLDQARAAGLSVTTEELQQATSAYRRRRHRLSAAADTHAWLLGRGLSVDDFQAGLEESLLAAQLKQHLTAPQAEGHFAAHRAGFELLRLALVRVERDDLAGELASQVRDEGRGLGDVAREHGLPVARHWLLRQDLDGPLAEAVADAATAELVGPVATPEGLALAVLEERRPAELDAAARQRLQDELFEGWLAERMKEATFDLERVGASA